jgi:hypothetical protein
MIENLGTLLLYILLIVQKCLFRNDNIWILASTLAAAETPDNVVVGTHYTAVPKNTYTPTEKPNLMCAALS